MGSALEPVKPLVFVVICQNPEWRKGKLQTGRGGPGLAQVVWLFSIAVLKWPSWECWGFQKEGTFIWLNGTRSSLPGFALQVTTVECAGVWVASRTPGRQVLATAASRHLQVSSSRVILVHSAWWEQKKRDRDARRAPGTMGQEHF